MSQRFRGWCGGGGVVQQSLQYSTFVHIHEFTIFGLEVFLKRMGSLALIGAVHQVSLKGLSHEIFGPVFWPVWMYLGLNVNRLWFSNFNYALLILDN